MPHLANKPLVALAKVVPAERDNGRILDRLVAIDDECESYPLHASFSQGLHLGL